MNTTTESDNKSATEVPHPKVEAHEEGQAREEGVGKIAASNNPEKFRDRVEQTNLLDLDPNKIPPELLDKIANRMIEQALASRAAVEEVNRRLVAGESVELEDITKAI